MGAIEIGRERERASERGKKRGEREIVGRSTERERE